MSSPTTKPTCLSQPMVKSVLVYRNGDPFFPGHRVVIHEKKVSNFEVFLKEVTGGVKAPFGAVRSIYTPRGGHRVHQLEELQSGEHYVAGGREAFKKLNYLDIGEAKKKPAEINNEVKPVTHSRINVSARFRKPLQEPCTIFLIANGDLINPAVRLFIPRKTLNQWDHVLEMVTEKVTLRSGAVHRLYTLDGKLVQSGSDLENGQFYVAVGRDKFKKLPYGDLLFSKSTIRRPQGSKASSLPPVVGSRKSKGSGNDRQSKSTVGSHDTGDMVSSPQPPKRKEKREQTQEKISFSNKPTKVKQNIRATTYILQDNDEGIYKAGEKRSETWGAAEIQEDEDTQVEVPVDQVALILNTFPFLECFLCPVICSCQEMSLSSMFPCGPACRCFLHQLPDLGWFKNQPPHLFVGSDLLNLSVKTNFVSYPDHPTLGPYKSPSQFFIIVQETTPPLTVFKPL
uniref:Doublecortin domain-containing protein 2 n=1 Tax=Gopherus evgoodei TaxID=1825980 RepID=A0A8C4VML0_9SAUR